MIHHSSNLIGLPTGLIASASFNEFPIPLHIRGTRESHSLLFEALKKSESLEAARLFFLEYMSETFGERKRRARRFHASFLQVLEDWSFDSNGQAGAVLKGWVESRFGLFPTFHKKPIRRFNSPAWIVYFEEKMSSRFNNNEILIQFDLLYEFCQWATWHFSGKKHLVLYRGTNDMNDLVQERKSAIVRLNSLTSFTSKRSIADEFGDTIMEVEVPAVKLLFYNELLKPHTLQSESEYLVIGGDYLVKLSYC